MMPWGHFAVAYIPYALYTLVREKRIPNAGHTIVLMWATQLPDLIDKPLAWSFHFLPSGRSLAHSIFFVTPYVLVVTLVAWKADREKLGALFTFGYLSHIYADMYPSVFNPTHRFLPNLFFPLLQVQPDERANFLVHFQHVEPTAVTIAKIGLLALVTALVLGNALWKQGVRKEPQ